MNDSSINKKAIEELLAPKIQNIYKHQLKHQLENVSYYLFDRTFVVILEGTVTIPEKLLKSNNKNGLAKQVREIIDGIIQPQIRATIEEVMNVKVVDFLCDTTIESDCTCAIAIFESRQP